jgi:hypothetical protein
MRERNTTHALAQQTAFNSVWALMMMLMMMIMFVALF